MDKARPMRIVATPRFFDAQAAAFLRERGGTVTVAEDPFDGGLPHDALIALLDGADGWIVGQADVTRDLLAALPRLKAVVRRGVGYERVDAEAARALGRVVAIAPGGNDASTADHALMLMLAAGRKLKPSHDAMRGGDWSIQVGTDLYARTVGLIGLGRIGRGVVRRLRGFDATILVHTPRPDEAYARETGVAFVDLPTLLRESDYVSLHAPLTPQTRHLIDAAALRTMKPTAILINTARGGLVDDAALLAALDGGLIAAAGLDVFEAERDPAMRPVADALLARPDVAATPHAAGSTTEALIRTNGIAAEIMLALLEGRDPPAGCVVADGRGGLR